VGNGINLVPNLPDKAVIVVHNVCNALIVVFIAFAISGALNYVNELYARRPEAKNRPIKGYIQVVKIVLYAIAVILVIATLIERSPLLLLSGLGAMAAVLSPAASRAADTAGASFPIILIMSSLWTAGLPAS